MNLMRLNFGCGIHAPRHWSNYDASYRVWIDHLPFLHPLFGYQPRFAPWVRRLNVSCGLPHSKASAEYIYSSHMLEHLEHEDAKRFLKECARVLAPGGRIRIMTPNVYLVVRDYLARRDKADLRSGAADFMMECLGVFEDNGSRWLSWARRKNTHKWLYDEFNLKALLEQSGFSNVRAETAWVSDFPDLEALEPKELRDGSVCAEGYR
jgi:predicted SAM-dependent methyltransferase